MQISILITDRKHESDFLSLVSSNSREGREYVKCFVTWQTVTANVNFLLHSLNLLNRRDIRIYGHSNFADQHIETANVNRKVRLICLPHNINCIA